MKQTYVTFMILGALILAQPAAAQLRSRVNASTRVETETTRVELDSSTEIESETEDQEDDEDEDHSASDDSEPTAVSEDERAWKERSAREKLNDIRENGERVLAEEGARAEARAEVREERQEQMEERQEKRAERRGEIIERLASNIIVRLEAGVRRLTQASNRVQTAIDNATNEGLDMTSAQASLDAAIQHMTMVETNITDIETMIDAWADIDITSETFQEIISTQNETFRATMQEARQNLRNAAEELRSAVREIITARTAVTAEAETTTSVDTDTE